MRKISVIHPSRCRPHEAFETASHWRDMSDEDFEYILSLDNSDPSLQNYLRLFDYFGGNVVGFAHDNCSAIEAINKAAEVATGDLFVIISDDFQAFKGWDTALKKWLNFNHDFCCKTSDGLQKTLITLPIMDRLYYERFGYIYFPGYKHMFCDQELTAVALMTDHFVEAPLTFKHNHYSTGKSPKDAINIKNDATWKQGEALFNERLKTNFGIESPVMAYSDIIWK